MFEVLIDDVQAIAWILPVSCLILPMLRNLHVPVVSMDTVQRSSGSVTRGNDRPQQQQSAIAAMREELARRVAYWTHGKRDVITTLPGLILHRRDAPEPGVCEFHPPGLALIVQGSKQVERGRKTFT